MRILIYFPEPCGIIYLIWQQIMHLVALPLISLFSNLEGIEKYTQFGNYFNLNLNNLLTLNLWIKHESVLN